MFIETSAKAGFNIKVKISEFCIHPKLMVVSQLHLPSHVGSCVLNAFCQSKLQPLFRKIAAALPGMETLSSTKQEDMVDVNLKPTVNSSQTEQQGGGCSC